MPTATLGSCSMFSRVLWQNMSAKYRCSSSSRAPLPLMDTLGMPSGPTVATQTLWPPASRSCRSCGMLVMRDPPVGRSCTNYPSRAAWQRWPRDAWSGSLLLRLALTTVLLAGADVRAADPAGRRFRGPSAARPSPRRAAGRGRSPTRAWRARRMRSWSRSASAAPRWPAPSRRRLQGRRGSGRPRRPRIGGAGEAPFAASSIHVRLRAFVQKLRDLSALHAHPSSQRGRLEGRGQGAARAFRAAGARPPGRSAAAATARRPAWRLDVSSSSIVSAAGARVGA